MATAIARLPSSLHLNDMEWSSKRLLCIGISTVSASAVPQPLLDE